MASTVNHFDVTGRVVCLTGAAGFLGSAYTEALLAAGATVVALDRDRNALAELETRSASGQLMAFEADVSDRPRIAEVADSVARRVGAIDVLINNAAVNPAVRSGIGNDTLTTLEALTLSEWDEAIRVGLTGALVCAQVIGLRMAERGTGHIIQISSDLGVVAPDQRLYEGDAKKPVSYSVVKTGVLGLTRYLATYWALQGVRSNALVLGGVQRDQPADFIERISKLVPLGRMANPADYIGPLLFLVSEASAYMNGASLVVDGGRTVW